MTLLAQLLVQRVDGREPIISLRDANLSGALLIRVDLSGADLRFANLSDANLSDADLSRASLWQTDLSGADLSGAFLNNALLWGTDLPNADLSDADLSDADLRDADLPNADLSGAFLRTAVLYDATLTKTNLSGAFLKNADLLRADLSGADLSGAFLKDADLSNADLLRAELSRTELPNADLSGADLSAANLRATDLSAANLSGADGVSKEILKQQAKSLRAATMPDGTVFPHRYVTEEFDPAFYFDADEDWAFGSPETPDQVWIQRGTEGGQLLFTNPSDVFDPSNLSEPKKLPEPENASEWVSWLQRHPNLETSKPVSVSVGGASGMRINVTASSTPENYPLEFCGQQPCVPLYPLSDGNGVICFEGFKDGFVIVDVGNETVLIDVAARAEKFDEFLPKAQKVLESVEWKGG